MAAHSSDVHRSMPGSCWWSKATCLPCMAAPIEVGDTIKGSKSLSDAVLSDPVHAFEAYRTEDSQLLENLNGPIGSSYLRLR